ncbi:sodium-dependent transporter [Govanella unica]|uniref:Transporter n=1 Tax=Govanella unica TaxID=2975056 RepID=A0A9X3Z8I2_9PROT|nr:sodium-dependent transporter [Govania unica]
MAQDKIHETWSSRTMFLLATVGAAVGLGSLWRFPYITGENGGGAFVLLYIGFIVLLGLPAAGIELALGRLGKQSPLGTMKKLVERGQNFTFWKVIGVLSLLIPFFAMTYYSVIASWTFDYFLKSVTGQLQGIKVQEAEDLFRDFLSSPLRMLCWYTLYIAVVVFVIGRGVRAGLEKASTLMMPALFLLLLGLVAYAALYGDFGAALTFLFKPDFSKVTATTFLLALGQALFSMGIGVGALMTYGAYLSDDVSLPRSAIIVGLSVTFVSLLAGLAIFPFVFSFGLNPGEGPGLIFVTLPLAFGQLHFGTVLGGAFFLLMAFAALTSSFAMLEPIVSWLEERQGWSRMKLAATAGIAAWFVGLAPLLSFNVWGSIKLLPFVALIKDKTIFELFDFVVANLLLPANSILIALFAGWALSRASLQTELRLTPLKMAYTTFVAKVGAPAAIFVIFLSSFS